MITDWFRHKTNKPAGTQYHTVSYHENAVPIASIVPGIPAGRYRNYRETSNSVDASFLGLRQVMPVKNISTKWGTHFYVMAKVQLFVRVLISPRETTTWLRASSKDPRSTL